MAMEKFIPQVLSFVVRNLSVSAKMRDRCNKKRSRIQNKSGRGTFLVETHEILNCLPKHLCSRESHLLKPAAVYPAKSFLMVYRFLSKISFKSLKFLSFALLRLLCAQRCCHHRWSSNTCNFAKCFKIEWGMKSFWRVKHQLKRWSPKGPSVWKCESSNRWYFPWIAQAGILKMGTACFSSTPFRMNWTPLITALFLDRQWKRRQLYIPFLLLS